MLRERETDYLATINSNLATQQKDLNACMFVAFEILTSVTLK
jgi:hypothetical protein